MAKQIPVSDYLKQILDLSGKTQREIAQEVGWSKPNVLSMMKQGMTKVPIDKAPALAKACGVDPAVFLRIVMMEYMPEVWQTVVKNIGEPLSDEEFKLITAYRDGNLAEMIETNQIELTDKVNA